MHGYCTRKLLKDQNGKKYQHGDFRCYSSRYRSISKPTYIGPTAKENANDPSNIHMGAKRPLRYYPRKKYHNKTKGTVREC